MCECVDEKNLFDDDTYHYHPLYEQYVIHVLCISLPQTRQELFLYLYETVQWKTFNFSFIIIGLLFSGSYISQNRKIFRGEFIVKVS